MSEDDSDIMFTLITPTFRYGGIDILLESLRQQEYTNFECILVDELYDERKLPVKWYSRRVGLYSKFIHIPPKEREMDKNIGLSNARNTALALAEGEYIVQFDDYTFLKPYCLKRFVERYYNYGKSIQLAIRRTYENPDIIREEGSLSNYADYLRSVEGLDYEEYGLFEENSGVMEITQNQHVLNLGCLPLKDMLAIGGYDERYDNGHGHDDADIMYRLRQRGLDAYMDTGNINAHIKHPNQPTPNTKKNAMLFEERKESGDVKAKHQFSIKEFRDSIMRHKEVIRNGEEPQEVPLRWGGRNG